MTFWKEYKLEEICSKVTSGGTPNTRKDDYYSGNIPWVRTQEVNFNRLYDTEIKISEEGLNNSSAKWIPENSIIIAMYGATAGKVAINKIPVTTNQACCNLVIDKEKADYRFTYYNILSRFSSIANMAVGGAQQNLNAGMIKDLPIILPDLPTQRAIAETLPSLDDKIQLNNKMNQEVVNLAQILFKQWFIDFEFPNENGEPYKSSGGEMVDCCVRNYQNNLITSAQVIEELINLGKSIREADKKGEDLGLDFREYAFYSALEVSNSAVAILGDEVLQHIARQLVNTVKKNTSIDWTVRENVQAKMRIAVKKILRKYRYPPDMELKATETVIEQAKSLADQLSTTSEYKYTEDGMGLAAEPEN